MPSDDIFRLHGRSIALHGYSDDTRYARPTVLRLAEEDGWNVQNLGMTMETKAALRMVIRLAEARLQSGPLELYQGDDRRFYYLGDFQYAPRGPLLDDLASVMRLTPYTGVAVGFERRVSLTAFIGVRSVVGEYPRSPTERTELRWRAGVLGRGYDAES